MPEAVIVSALRTPIGTARKGTLRDTSAYELAHHVVSEAAAGLDSVPVDDVILGEGLYGGGVLARHAALTAGLTSVPGLAQNRHCAAGQAAVQSAAASVRAGMDQLIIAGESTPRPRPRGRECKSTANGSTGFRRPIPIAPTRPTWTCRSRSAGMRPSQPESAARRWTAGRCAHTATRSPRSTRAGSKRRSSRLRRRTVCSRSTSIPVATPPWRSWPRSSRCTPRSKASRSPRATPAAPTTALPCSRSPATGWDCRRSRRSGPGRRWVSTRRDRPGARRGNPESACPGGTFAGRHRPVRNQRGVRFDVCGHRQTARHRSRLGQCQRQRLLAGTSGGGHRSPNAGDAGARIAVARWRFRRGSDVCGRRNGLRDGHRGTGAINSPR